MCCAIAVAELQLEQARRMLAKGGAMCGLAAALLTSSYQQLSTEALHAAAASRHAAGLLDAKKQVGATPMLDFAAPAPTSAAGPHLTRAIVQVLALLCMAHLAGGDAGSAAQVLDTLECEAPGTAAAEAHLRQLCVEVKVAAGRAPEALRFLMALIQQQPQPQPQQQHDALPATEGLAPTDAGVASFLAGLRVVLRHISAAELPSFQSAVSAFVWRTAAADPPTPLLNLVQLLLAQEQAQVRACARPSKPVTACGVRAPPPCCLHVTQGGELCHRLALHMLSGEDVSAALHRHAGILAEVHGLLFHRATHSLEAGACAAAKELFAAALQFARPHERARDARALAACHSRLGMHQRAVEYLDLAARHEQQPGSLTQLARLQALAHTGDTLQVGAAGGSTCAGWS